EEMLSAQGDFTKVRTVAEQRDLFPTGPGIRSRLAQIGFRIHHTVPEYIQELLGIPEFNPANPAHRLWDDVPSWLLDELDHTAGESSFHKALESFVPERTLRGEMTNSEIVDGLRKAYEKVERQQNGPVWQVVQSWLHSRGF